MEENKIAYISLKFGPLWEYVGIVRNFAEAFLSASLGRENKNELIVMALGELVGNVVKYSSKGHATLTIDIFPSQIVVQTTNQTDPENASRLLKEFEEINRGSAIEAYARKLQKTMETSSTRQSLGLVRIRYETHSELSCHIENNQVKMKVVIPTIAINEVP